MRRTVAFPSAVWAADLAAVSDEGRKVAVDERKRIELNGGLDEADLYNCQDPGPDGTSLPDCVKTYLGPPTTHGGPNYRMVLMRVKEGLVMIAFGYAHLPRSSTEQTVYQLAHDRINN